MSRVRQGSGTPSIGTKSNVCHLNVRLSTCQHRSLLLRHDTADFNIVCTNKGEGMPVSGVLRSVGIHVLCRIIQAT